MSWSISTKGRDPDDVQQNLNKAREGSHCPPQVADAIEKAVDAFGANPAIERDIWVSSHGHIDQGLGDITISIKVTKKPVDASTPEGARELADRMKS